jgi:hypothetical protein
MFQKRDSGIHDGKFKFEDFAEAPGLIEDEPSINISRHLIAKSIYALFPNSAKEFWETEDPRIRITTLNYPMPTINLLDPQKTESYQPGPILENKGTKADGVGKRGREYQRLSLLRNRGCQICPQHEIPPGSARRCH